MEKGAKRGFQPPHGAWKPFPAKAPRPFGRGAAPCSGGGGQGFVTGDELVKGLGSVLQTGAGTGNFIGVSIEDRVVLDGLQAFPTRRGT